MLVSVSAAGVFTVLLSVGSVPMCGMSVMSRLFVAPGFVMLGRFRVMVCGLCMMFRCSPMMLCGCLRHRRFLHVSLSQRSYQAEMMVLRSPWRRHCGFFSNCEDGPLSDRAVQAPEIDQVRDICPVAGETNALLDYRHGR